jgi:hypothetical protein
MTPRAKLFVAILLLTTAIAALWTGVAISQPTPMFDGYGDRALSPGITRYEDEEANVICWLSSAGGIACLPVEQTEY